MRPKGSTKTVGSGRKKGTPNKLTATVKDNVIAVFNQMGGAENMLLWAKANETEFYRMYAKLLPTETAITGALTIVQKHY